MISEHLASQVVERRNGDSLEVVEIAAQAEKRHARIARRFQQIAFGILLKKRAVLPPVADSPTQMNFGDRLAARAYQLSAAGRHVDGERLQQLIGQLEASHHAAALANTMRSQETEPEMSAVLVFLLRLADSDTESRLRDGNSCSGLVEIGSSVPMRRQQLAAPSQPQRQHPFDSHIAPVYGGQGMVGGSQEGKAFMQYPSQLFSVAARPVVGSGGKTRDGIGRCFPVFAPEDFRLPAAAWDRAAEGEEPVFRAVDDAIERRRNLPQSVEVGFHRCCGSMTFWCGSGSADPCL
jgi:hypothetical protein